MSFHRNSIWISSGLHFIFFYLFFVLSSTQSQSRTLSLVSLCKWIYFCTRTEWQMCHLTFSFGLNVVSFHCAHIPNVEMEIGVCIRNSNRFNLNVIQMRISVGDGTIFALRASHSRYALLNNSHSISFYDKNNRSVTHHGNEWLHSGRTSDSHKNKPILI